MDEAIRNIRNDLQVDLLAFQELIDRMKGSATNTARTDGELLERLQGHLNSVLRGLNAKLGDRG
jgi:hypothetical protein